ncbi:MAG: RluA family pseudouridine synthase [Cyclobacteriaceae bacterium]|nr:RluA family pseudouridine synthase [Cyclobacteriaceae bacterium]
MSIYIPDLVLFEDEYIVVINKPTGLMVEPDRNQNPSLLNEVKKYLQAATGETAPYAQHIHRLDRAVSGIVLFTKKREALKNLSEQFAERRVKKFYKAITNQAPPKRQGRLEHWHRKEKKKAALYNNPIEYSENAILDYTVTALPDNKFLWDIELQTGKYHQVRAQLASTGCPIIGDALYGSDIPYQPNAIALQAWRLVFEHPASKQVMDIKIDLTLARSTP